IDAGDRERDADALAQRNQIASAKRTLDDARGFTATVERSGSPRFDILPEPARSGAFASWGPRGTDTRGRRGTLKSGNDRVLMRWGVETSAGWRARPNPRQGVPRSSFRRCAESLEVAA